MSLRSPLGKVLGSGSAKDGTEHWWQQRVTAVALLLLGGWFLYAFAGLENFTHTAVSDWAGRPFNSVMLLLLSVTLAWHSALGVQVVLEDYVHAPFIKVLALIANRFVHVFLAIVAIISILGVALRGAT
ncbi:MAG: succinate dehydrogenase, hydrophobic membrane anchor protein [Woeseiaceae bacterium]|nr:succinate dehydrogenase, hydrophobic membrane anchor protein [Woeseiaceae bacterium]